MERLTDYHVGENGAYMKCSGNCRGGLCENCEELEKIIDRLAAYEDTGLKPEEVKEFLEDVESRFVLWINNRYGIPATKFMDIMQAEKDGRLLVLPVKEGMTIYRVRLNFDGDHYEIIEKDFDLARFRPEDFGRIVFKTREEAEAALKKREADDEALR